MNLITKNYLLGKFEELKRAYDNHENRLVIQEKADHLCLQFLEAGVTEIELLLEMMSWEGISRHYEKLSKLGVRINTKEMLESLSSQAICEHLTSLCGYCDVDDVIDNMYIDDVQENLFELMHLGASIERVKARFDSEGKTIDFDKMLDHLSVDKIAKDVNLLLRWGCDADELVDRLPPEEVETNILMLMHEGADAEKITHKLYDAGEKEFLCWSKQLFEEYYAPYQLISSRALLSASAS